jgi:predicted nucleic acid-binding protein
VRRICLYLSVLTLGEIRKGIASLRDASRRVTLEAWLDSDLVLRFAERILPIDHAVADRWGQIAAPAAAAKSPLPVIDGLRPRPSIRTSRLSRGTRRISPSRAFRSSIRGAAE